MVKKSLAIGLAVVSAACAAIFCPNCGNTHVSAAASDLNITAKAAYLVEANSGKIIFAKDEHKRLPIASMVKITTLAVIYDALESGQIHMDDKVMVSREASGMGGSQAFLDFDTEYSVEDLLKSIIIASANDSCIAMAELIAGSESEFVGRMNELAAKLGLTDTNYVNCTGLPAANSYSSSADVAKMYQYIMKSPFYSYEVAWDPEIAAQAEPADAEQNQNPIDDGSKKPMNLIWMYNLVHPSGRVTGLTNTNKHVRFFNGCTGGKTGYTAEAGHCITVSALRGSIRPVAVIIGGSDSATRFKESGDLMNYVFNNYENKLIVDKNQKIGTVRVKNAFEDNIDVYAKENYFDLVKKGDKRDAGPTVNVEFVKSAKAPINRDTALGKIIVTDEGAVIKEIDVVSKAAVEGMNYWDAVKKVTRSYKF